MRLVSNTFIVLVAICCAPSWGVEYSERTWTDDEGRSVQAKLVRLSGSTAILDQDGKIVRAPVNRLSDADQQWVKQVRELNRWREWTMIDGSKRRLKFEDRNGDDISLKEGSNTIDVTLDQLSDADRELLAVVFDTAPATRPGFGNPLAGGSPTTTAGVGGTRQWTNVNGKKIDAEYRGVEGENVVLFFQNREWRVALSQFSQADQDWVAQQSVAPAGGANPFSPTALPRIANAGGNGFDNARNDIQGRMNPGFNSDDSDPRELSQAERSHYSAMAHLDAMRQRQDQERVERERREAERVAEMQRRHQERLAMREQVRPQSIDPAPSTPSHSVPVHRETYTTTAPANQSTYPTSTPSQEIGVWVHQYQCPSCKHMWESEREYKPGDSCPKCHKTFDAIRDKNGDIIAESASATSKRWVGMIRIAFFVGVAICGFLARMSSR